MSEAGKWIFRAANEWWRCAQYFVIAFCGYMSRDNRCCLPSSGSLLSRRRGSWTHKSIPLDSAIDPQLSNALGVRCKRLVAKLHSQYGCRVFHRTPCACSPAVDGSVLIVVVRECIVVSGSVSAPHPLLGVGGLSVLCWMVKSTTCVCRFCRLSFLLVPSLGRTVEWWLEWIVSFMGLGLGSWVVMPWQAWSFTR